MHFPRDFTSPADAELERLARLRRAYGIVPDGQRVAVPLMLMDGKTNNDRSSSDNDDPCAVAYAERNAWLADAWRNPVASPHPNLANRGEDGDAEHGDDVAEHRVATGNRASADGADSDAQARREDANARYVAHLVNAWKEP
jgi:hypothetical protein